MFCLCINKNDKKNNIYDKISIKRESMARCVYCRRYTVNGRCPVCNRMYEEPNKRYDFYGKEIKPKSTPNKKSSSSDYSQSTYFPSSKGSPMTAILICFFFGFIGSIICWASYKENWKKIGKGFFIFYLTIVLLAVALAVLLYFLGFINLEEILKSIGFGN